MGDSMYESIRHELLVMRDELRQSLYRNTASTNPQVRQYIQDDLDDVERALLKLEIGVFGVDESTGAQIPYHKLSALPTARTEEEIIYH
ncbi:hypothetical protein FH5_00911 [Priestia endophytica]|jgi:DnaK suppressor protein|nr:hypothetical protein FH5_00911 [Priestia endophytica]